MEKEIVKRRDAQNFHIKGDSFKNLANGLVSRLDSNAFKLKK